MSDREHGRLAAAGVADEADELALGDVEVEVFDDDASGPRRREASWRAGRTRETDRLRAWSDLLAGVGSHRGGRGRDGEELDDLAADVLVRGRRGSRAGAARARQVDRDRRGRARAPGPGVSGWMRSASKNASSRSLVMSSMVDRRSPQRRAQLVLQRGARQRVERAERLVEEQHLRLDGEAARHAHALAHPARELGGPLVRRRPRPTSAIQVLGARAPRGRRPVGADGVDGELDVLEHASSTAAASSSGRRRRDRARAR